MSQLGSAMSRSSDVSMKARVRWSDGRGSSHVEGDDKFRTMYEIKKILYSFELLFQCVAIPELFQLVLERMAVNEERFSVSPCI